MMAVYVGYLLQHKIQSAMYTWRGKRSGLQGRGYMPE